MSNLPTDDENNRRDDEPSTSRPVDGRETLDELSAGATATPLTAGEPLTPGAVVPNTISPPPAGGNGSPERQWRWESRGRRNPAAATLALVAVVSAIIGSMISMMVVPYLSAYFSPKPQLPNPSGTGITQTALPNTSDPPSVYVAQKVGPAIVTIINQQRSADFFGRTSKQITGGTGVIIDASGYIVTNNHVVEATAGLTVTLSDGRSLSATVVGADPASDLAVIKVNATGLPTAELGDSDKMRVGDIAIAIGNPVDPSSFQRTVTQGIISGLNRKIEQGDRILTMIQTDAAINPGNSGGPLCNTAGQVIAINTAKISESQNVEGIGLSIPVNVARPIINELISKGKVSRVWIGAGLMEKEPAAAYYGIKFDQGLLVREVRPGSPSDRAGVRVGDIITKADGQTLNSMVELKTILDTKRPGQQMRVDLVRDNKTMNVTLTLVEQPADIGQ